ncbi:MAG: hypothetical protein KJ956_05125 [Actinobacteria bacterium]|nr:hypothetical protein [Actinomycetota bacterium]
MTGAMSCPNGHPAEPGTRFCAVCGAAVAAPPPPPPPPGRPWAAPPPVEPAGPTPRNTNRLPVVIGGAALIAAAVFAVVTLTGDDTTPGVTVAATVAPTSPATQPPGTTGETTPPETTPETIPETVPGLDPDSWTVLVYVIADNNLEDAALADLAEMAQVTPQDRFDIVALVDRNEGEVSDGAVGLPDWADTKLLHIEGGQATVIAEYGEADMGDPAVLTEFVTTGLTDYPAAHTALILWDHGAAVFGIGPDDSETGELPSVISPAELAPAIRLGLEAAGVERLDIIGFDACLMGSFEIATGMAPIARYMIASEESEPGVGWDWTALEYLAVEPHPTAAGLGEAIVTAYHLNPVVADLPDHTLSMVDLDMMDELEAALADLVDPLTASMGDYAPVLGRQRAKVITFGKNPDPWNEFHLVDLGNLVQRLGRQSPDLADRAAGLRQILEESVVAIGNGEQVKQALGLTVFFPSFPEYWNAVLPYYDAMPATAWRRVLDAYFATGRAIPPERHPAFEGSGEAGTEFVEPSGLHVSAEFAGATPGDIAEVRLLLGTETGGTTTFFSDYPGEVEGTTATAVHGLEAVLLTNRAGEAAIDTEAIPVFHRITRTATPTGSITTVEIPLAYYPAGVAPGGDDYQPAVFVEHAVLDASADDWTTSRQLLVTTSSGTLGSVTPNPAGVLVPMYLQDGPEGRRWLPIASDNPLPADLDMLDLTIWTWGFPGTELVVELTVTDFGGNSASAAAAAVVPADWQTGVG